MPLISILAEKEDDVLPPPPPILRGAPFPIDDLLLEQVHRRERGRLRAAVALSVLGNILALLILLLGQKLFPPITLQLVSPPTQPEHLTYLELPPDLITRKRTTQPKALSNRNRHFDHPTPLTRSISEPATRPAPRPRPAQPPPGAPARRAPAPPVRAAAEQPRLAKPATGAKAGGAPETGQLELENVPQPKAHPSLKLDIGPANMLQRAIQGAARDAAHGHQAVTEVAPLPQPPAGSGNTAPGQTGAGVQILTDTEGVNFDSYLRQVLEIVRRNWYAVMPETVYLGTKGRVVVVFNINASGTVPGIKPVSLSGTASLDQAAEASISASNPFPPLPSAFHGPSITLQFSFYYNLTPPSQ
ncbi:MAG: energy transducer TonB [Terriglobales bacterium]